MRFIVKVIVVAFALWLTTFIVSGVRVVPYEDTTLATVLTYLLVALIFGLVNAIVGTFVRIIAFPLYVLTLGLISFIVNGLLLLLVAWISELMGFGLVIDGFWWGVLGRPRAGPHQLADRTHRAPVVEELTSRVATQSLRSPAPSPVTSPTSERNDARRASSEASTIAAVSRYRVSSCAGNTASYSRPGSSTLRDTVTRSGDGCPAPPVAGTRSSSCSIESTPTPSRVGAEATGPPRLTAPTALSSGSPARRAAMTPPPEWPTASSWIAGLHAGFAHGLAHGAFARAGLGAGEAERIQRAVVGDAVQVARHVRGLLAGDESEVDRSADVDDPARVVRRAVPLDPDLRPVVARRHTIGQLADAARRRRPPFRARRMPRPSAARRPRARLVRRAGRERDAGRGHGRGGDLLHPHRSVDEHAVAGDPEQPGDPEHERGALGCPDRRSEPPGEGQVRGTPDHLVDVVDGDPNQSDEVGVGEQACGGRRAMPRAASTPSRRHATPPSRPAARRPRAGRR